MRTSELNRLRVGGLWRDVVNFLGRDPVVPDILIPLLHSVVPRWAGWTYFLGQLPQKLIDPQDRDDLANEVARARIGHRLWVEEQDQLAKWAAIGEGGQLTKDQLADWWLGGHRDVLILDEDKRLTQFLEQMKFATEEHAIISRLINDDGRGLAIYRLREHLHWLNELGILRELSTKTWPADPRQRRGWSPDELAWVNRYYADQAPEVSAETRNGVIDPMELESVSDEDSLGFGMTELTYSMYVLMRAAVIDFAGELLEATRFPRVRGSLRCIDCGQFAGRRSLGYGQLYCSDQCKKRAAKRRYRTRVQQRERSVMEPSVRNAVR
jgi:hypothetical protein